MRHPRNWTVLVLTGLLAQPLAAQEKADKKAPQEVASEISQAIGKNDIAAAKAAFARAQALRDKYDDKKFAPVFKAIGKGLTHKENELALGAIETLGKLKGKGTSKLLGKLLSPPNKVPTDKLNLHVAAFVAAGEIADPDSTKTLEKALSHPVPEVASAAAAAFAGFRSLETKPRTALVQRLVKELDKLEKKANAGKDEELKGKYHKVAGDLNESLGKLTGHTGPSTADDWEKWIKEGGKPSDAAPEPEKEKEGDGGGGDEGGGEGGDDEGGGEE